MEGLMALSFYVMKLYIVIILTLVYFNSAYSQYGCSSSLWLSPPSKLQSTSTGANVGYNKVLLNKIDGKQKYYYGCNANWDSHIPPNPTVIFGASAATSGNCLNNILYQNNADSSYKGYSHNINGTFITSGTPTFSLFYLTLGNQYCNTCYQTYFDPLTVYKKLTEFHCDSNIISYSQYFPYTMVDSTTQSITLFQKTPDIFDDSLCKYLRNVEPFGGVPVAKVYNLFTSAPYAYYYSRVYHFQDYDSIHSPELNNTNTIAAIRGVPQTWNPGIWDTESDSIAVKPLNLRLSNSRFHPSYVIGGSPSLPLSIAQQTFIKHALTDSSQDIIYKPGFSAAQPFGANAAYTLQPATGQISFTAQDTGVYLLAYRIEEYRDGQLLGDMMNVRIAIVRDSVGIKLPQLSVPNNLTGGSYDAATNILTVCSGQSVSFSASATSVLSNAQIALTTNADSAASGSTITYSGGGTASANATFSWSTQNSDNGFHHLYFDAIDTACGPGHLPVHGSKGITIHVISPVSINAQSRICVGDTLLLQAIGGYNPIWSTLPGGDPQLSCVACASQKVTPDSTTAYVLTRKFGACQSSDTTTVTVIRQYTVIARDTSFLNAVPANYVLDATVSPIGNYYKYSWSPAATVDSPNILHPHPLNPANTNVFILTVTDSSGCFSAKDTLVLKSNTSGVHTITSTAAPLLRLHPNPAENVLYIDYTSAGSFRLYDLLGRAVLLETLPAGAYSKNISVIDFPAGVYTYRFEDKEGRKVNGKVVISR